MGRGYMGGNAIKFEYRFIVGMAERALKQVTRDTGGILCLGM